MDQGSYQSTVELRAKLKDAWFTATIPTRSEMSCKCQGPDCDRVTFEPGSFDLGESTLAVGGGGFSNVLGSLNRKTLIAQETDRGLEVGLTDAETITAQRIISDAAVADMYARPILVKPTDVTEGHSPAVIEPRRRRLWL